MATNYKQSGKRVLINSASGTITAGKLVAQEGFFGVALTNAATGAALWLGIEGVWNIDVYSGTTKGQVLYAAGAAGVISDAVALTLSPTGANSNTCVAKALTGADTAGKADCLLLAQGAAIASIQH
jgi:predicted RecA/RadA family phage recombinase